MGHISTESLLAQAGGSIYTLMRLASVRALELADGRPVLVEKVLNEKTATTALREIAARRVVSKASSDMLFKEEETSAS